MQQESSKKIFTIPNLLSFFRILLIPLMWYLYVIAHEPGWTVAVLALSGLSDLVDGKIARKYHMTSDLGKVLDPIADKLTQVTLVVCLISQRVSADLGETPNAQRLAKSNPCSVEGLLQRKSKFLAQYLITPGFKKQI